MRSQYENKISDMQNKMIELQETQDSDIKVLELQEQLKNALNLASQSNNSLQESHSMADVTQKRRIIELEALIDQQGSRIDAILQDKSNLETQLLSKIQEKDTLIESYESRIVELQTAFQDKIFLVDESKHMDFVHNLELELEKSRRQVLHLENRQLKKIF